MRPAADLSWALFGDQERGDAPRSRATAGGWHGSPPAMAYSTCERAVTASAAAAYFRHEHADQPLILHTAQDVDRLVDALLAEPFANSVAAMYALARPRLPAGVPDHEFLVAVNAADDVGGVRYMGDGGTWYSKGTPSRHDEVFYYYTGSDRDFPHDSEARSSWSARPRNSSWPPAAPGPRASRGRPAHDPPTVTTPAIGEFAPAGQPPDGPQRAGFRRAAARPGMPRGKEH